MRKISIQNFKPEVISYFNLDKYGMITESKLLMIYIRKLSPIINIWTKSKFNYFKYNRAKSDDVFQIVCANLFEIINKFDSSYSIPFEKYLLNTIKFKILNEFNKFNCAQVRFENSLTWYDGEKIKFFMNSQKEGNSALSKKLNRIDMNNFIKTIDVKKLQVLKKIYSTNDRQNYSRTKINLLINELRNQYKNFFGY
ncbi:sigma-70 RNA polymerase sigma factor region 4 domain-containing protein [Mycoplasmopsis alligatoris]|uniref:Uncharacterized protein n=1 Tax=Mycoplasmopsis alligatoris A21JP2 TaxID=747682 RepID=D4XVV3_9BACT|nr:sigma factor [Mycoplasmopsis alligatoris]EFF41528.1 hypothetical protein MALL_0684 [Mycoplasmopsis alligatoris A21JP2]